MKLPQVQGGRSGGKEVLWSLELKMIIGCMCVRRQSEGEVTKGQTEHNARPVGASLSYLSCFFAPMLVLLMQPQSSATLFSSDIL